MRHDVRLLLTASSGSWVTRHLVVQYPQYNIVCFDKMDYVSAMENINCLKPFSNFRFVHGDITSPKQVEQALSENNIDCIMHFAACSHVQNSFHDQNSFTLNNVIGTQILLDSARRHGRINRFIHVSTDEVYGEADDVVDETKQFLPTNPYSASKAAAEMYVYAYYKSFKLPVVIVRSNNVFGPCQYPESKFVLAEQLIEIYCVDQKIRDHSKILHPAVEEPTDHHTRIGPTQTAVFVCR